MRAMSSFAGAGTGQGVLQECAEGRRRRRSAVGRQLSGRIRRGAGGAAQRQVGGEVRSAVVRPHRGGRRLVVRLSAPPVASALVLQIAGHRQQGVE